MTGHILQPLNVIIMKAAYPKIPYNKGGQKEKKTIQGTQLSAM